MLPYYCTCLSNVLLLFFSRGMKASVVEDIRTSFEIRVEFVGYSGCVNGSADVDGDGDLDTEADIDAVGIACDADDDDCAIVSWCMCAHSDHFVESYMRCVCGGRPAGFVLLRRESERARAGARAVVTAYVAVNAPTIARLMRHVYMVRDGRSGVCDEIFPRTTLS